MSYSAMKKPPAPELLMADGPLSLAKLCRPAVTGPPSDTGSSDQNNSAVGEHAPDDVVGDLAHVEPPKVVGHEGLPVRHSQRTHLAGIALQPS